MAFVVPGDPSYLRAKQAKLGQLRLPEPLDDLARLVEAKWGVRPLWLEIDRLTAPSELRRLSVVIERSLDYRLFSRQFSYDGRKQRAIAAMLATVEGATATDDVFVCFDDFERVATEEAHVSVTSEELRQFEESLGLGEQLWATSRLWGPPVVFVHTEEQARRLEVSDVRQEWADRWFESARRHDAFGYVRREDIVVGVDSKEVLDRDYDGNWSYYWK